jgi:hypothetical protein
MNADDFRQLLAESTDAKLLGPCLTDPLVPFCFDPDPPRWNTFRSELRDDLSLDAIDDIAVVGSGRFGFSLKPGANLKAFSERSDVDVVIVNANLFDELWHGLLRAAYPRPPILNKLGGWLGQCQKTLYTGWLIPLDIHLDSRIVGERSRAVLNLRFKWFSALKAASRHVGRRHEDVKGRLYRTWEHAELYHLHSLSVLRHSITEVRS